jgi:hypothetical protein
MMVGLTDAAKVGEQRIALTTAMVENPEALKQVRQKGRIVGLTSSRREV